VAEWREAVQQRQKRHAQRRAAGIRSARRTLGWLVIAGGIVLFAALNFNTIIGWANAFLTSGTWAAWQIRISGWYNRTVAVYLEEGISWLERWWPAFRETLEGPITEQEGYAYLFASIVFGTAVLPILIYLLGKTVRRLFP
jgi:hypothetical protein